MNLLDGNGKRICFFVPHPDDEINLGGAFIQLLTQHNWDVFCIVMTNGDYCGIYAERLAEYVESLAVLGVPKEKCLILGYPECDDTQYYRMIKDTHVVITNQAGISHTYGTKAYPDYHYMRTKTHRSYCLDSIIGDIKEILDVISPHIIVCNDEDDHIVHRLLSMAFDEAFRQSKIREKAVVLKGFSYPTSWVAPRDFYSNNIHQTVLKKGASIRDYRWEDRIRFPISKEGARRFLFSNSVHKALRQHKTQLARANAKSVINGDKVYWLKSGNPKMLPAYCKIALQNGDFIYRYYTSDVGDLDTLSVYVFQEGKAKMVDIHSTEVLLETKRVNRTRQSVKVCVDFNGESLTDEIEMITGGKYSDWWYRMLARIENTLEAIICYLSKKCLLPLYRRIYSVENRKDLLLARSTK